MRLGSLFNTLATVFLGFVAGMFTVQLVAPDLLSQTSGPVVPSQVTARIAATGEFQGIDTVRTASGRVQLLDGGDVQILRLVGFDVATAPDLQVWLTTVTDPEAAQDVRAADILSLGDLAYFEGDQTYVLPDGTNGLGYGAVLIWCAEFGELYGIAALES